MNGSRKKRNTRKKSVRTMRYFTHNNGDRPYMVRVRRKEVIVYTYPKHLGYGHRLTKDDYTEKIIEYSKVSKVFVGKSVPGDDMYASYPKNPQKASREGRGNSILVDLGNCKYSFIGHKIIEFTTKEPIKEYYSMIGNNDVPYPVAISDNYVYFMLMAFIKNKAPRISYISRSLFQGFPTRYSWALDSYSKLWGHNPMTKEGGIQKEYIYYIQNTNVIHNPY